MPAEQATGAPQLHNVSVVVPVYQGERTLEALAAEIEPLVREQTTARNRPFHVVEAIFVHDGAADGSHRVMQALAARYPFVRTIWLSRNYGQHPATLAGMASAAGDWVVTLDEDGQMNPADIGALLDVALDRGVQLVYARPTNAPPHGFVRNAFSSTIKWLFRLALGNRLGPFSSFRLINGEIARSLAAYCGGEAYIDVALSWVVRESAPCPVTLRQEDGGRRRSGYTFARLLEHGWRLVLTSGTRPLRLVALAGCLAIVSSFVISAYALYEKITARVPVQGWTSLTILVCLFSGIMLFALGIVAEYVGVTLRMAMGRPLYLIVSKPSHREVGRE
jgi:polyisoprenyl-phosphate glycosyltransferase